jgi:hypothetical protein
MLRKPGFTGTDGVRTRTSLQDQHESGSFVRSRTSRNGSNKSAVEPWRNISTYDLLESRFAQVIFRVEICGYKLRQYGEKGIRNATWGACADAKFRGTSHKWDEDLAPVTIWYRLLSVTQSKILLSWGLKKRPIGWGL